MIKNAYPVQAEWKCALGITISNGLSRPGSSVRIRMAVMVSRSLSDTRIPSCHAFSLFCTTHPHNYAHHVIAGWAGGHYAIIRIIIPSTGDFRDGKRWNIPVCIGDPTFRTSDLYGYYGRYHHSPRVIGHLRSAGIIKSFRILYILPSGEHLLVTGKAGTCEDTSLLNGLICPRTFPHHFARGP